MRVDGWLRKQYPGLKRRHVEEAIDLGWIVGPEGKKLKKGAKLEGVVPSCAGLDTHLKKLRAGNQDLVIEVVREKTDYWVIDKPPGIPSHPISLLDFTTVTNWAVKREPGIIDEFEEYQPTITPHRLDTGTSGILIVCTEKKAWIDWREQFSQGAVKKTYLAWCWGKPSWTQFEISDPIANCARNSRRMVVVSGEPRHVPPILKASSRVALLKQEGQFFLAKVECETGVTHQVRVHLAHLGFPLLGDKLYDRAHSSRALQFSFHQLRALRIETRSNIFQVPEKRFLAEVLSKA